MFENVINRFTRQMSKDKLAEILSTSPEALETFEKAYKKAALDKVSDNFFEVNAKQASLMRGASGQIASPDLERLIGRIVSELVIQTPVWSIDDGIITVTNGLEKNIENPVTNEEICRLPEEVRPQLTGTLMKIDVGEPSYKILLMFYKDYLKEKNPKKKQMIYDMFRQGIDILDLDPITYEMIGTNPNSMGHWLPEIAPAVCRRGFFRIPNTKIIKVPLTMLQLTRLDYLSLTRTTLDIVDRFCQRVFELDERQEYFIKTGTYSSKFDFRNAHVYGAKEVKELGEYLLFIHHQAFEMASPLNNVCIYGVSTTNEWVVREFIQDKENNPSIYKGLPLHTEYRIFVDFDEGRVLGVNPYWDPQVMKQRFGHEEDSDSPHNKHDYVIYSAYERTLMDRYERNKDLVRAKVEEFLPDVTGLKGQWSVDIMQNGEDFWLIDMALACNSALKECVPEGLLKPVEEDWIPKIGGKRLLNISVEEK